MREPPDWIEMVNAAETPEEVEALRARVKHGRPYGHEVWQVAMISRLGLEHTLRDGGRHKKQAESVVAWK